MAKISGGAVLAQALRKLGVTEIFALHGGHLDAFLVACPDNEIRLTDTRHEASAGHAAAAYSRATGQVGVCVITAGPGFTNGLTAIVDAWLDAVPVVFIAGAPPLREVETNPLQGGFDQVAMAAPVTKWAHRITHVERIPDLVEKAVRLARTGRPGPVFLEMPIDVMFGLVDADKVATPHVAELARPAPAPGAIEAMLDLLAAAKRPVVIAGSGACSPRCSSLLQDFASATGTPVAVNSKAIGAVPGDFPLNVGVASALGVAQIAMKAPPDLVILIGARMGLLLAGRSGSIVPHGAKLVHIDIDGAEIGRLKAADVGIVADSAEALAVAVERARRRAWPDRREWVELLARCASLPLQPFLKAPAESRPGLLHPFHAARAVAEALSADTAIAWDGGEAPAWFRPFIRSPGPGLALGNGYLGCLGVGQGFAIGLSRARPGKPVALIMGDGAAGFNIAEFDTMVRHRLPVLTIIFNNACWGMSQHGQELVFGRQRITAVKLAETDYHAVAAGFGCYGEKITRFEDIGPAVKRAQAQPLPACLNIMTDPDIVHPVTPMMVGQIDRDDEIAVPYYENIPTGR